MGKRYYYLYNGEPVSLDSELGPEYGVTDDPSNATDKYLKINGAAYRALLRDKERSLSLNDRESKSTDDLRLYSVAPYLSSKTIEEIKSTDFSLIEGLSVRKKYSRGYRVLSTYCADGSDPDSIPVVEREYRLIKSNGIPVSEEIDTVWYSSGGLIGMSKHQSISLSAKDSAKIMKDIRETRILYLQNPESEFVNDMVKKYIDILFLHYKADVNDYILNGSKSFEDAINKEKDPKINSILNYVLQDGKTVKESILYQIHEED